MAAPVADAYVAPSGADVYAGRYPGSSVLAGGATLADVSASGGVIALPAWVPSTAWEWTNIPSSTWSTYMREDGAGIAPVLNGTDPGPDLTYTSQWSYSAPCYSRANHELWMFGGGHAGTTINAVTRWNLNKNTPDVSMVSAPTPVATRNTYLQAETWRTTSYHTDGKPSSPHAYGNNAYLDAIDEFISFGIAETATGYPTASGGSAGSRDVAGLPRSGAWRAEDYYTDIPVGANVQPRGPRIPSLDGTAIFYWDGPDASNTIDLRKWVASTNTYSTIGASVIPYYSRQCEGASNIALVMGGADSAAGWQAKFVTLTTGSTAAVTVSGDSIPSGLECVGVAWCETFGYYVALWVNSGVVYSGATLTTAFIATITPTSSNTATAVVKTMTGSLPTAVVFKCVFYDPLFQTVIVVQGASLPVKTIKVS